MDTDLEALSANVRQLQEWMKVAWRSLAESSLSTFERTELRHEMKRCTGELRCCSQLIEAERVRQKTAGEQTNPNFGTLNFRLIGQPERRLEANDPDPALVHPPSVLDRLPLEAAN